MRNAAAGGSSRIIQFPPSCGRSFAFIHMGGQARASHAHHPPLAPRRTRPRLKAEGTAPHVRLTQVHQLQASIAGLR